MFLKTTAVLRSDHRSILRDAGPYPRGLPAMPRGENLAQLSINHGSKTTLALLPPQCLYVPTLLLSSCFIGCGRTTPGIQPQGVTLAVDDRQKEDQHDQVTYEHLQRRFGETQVPKTAAVLNGNTSGQHHAHECTEAQELHGDQQGCRRRTKAYEQGRAAADFDPWQK